MRSVVRFIIASLLAALPQAASARDGEGWVVSWTGSVQGPYPVGNPSAQPDQKFAFPDPATGARDQTFRLMVRPDLWGRQHPAQQCLRQETSDVRRRACRLAIEQCCAVARIQPSGDVQRKAFHHHPTRKFGME